MSYAANILEISLMEIQDALFEKAHTGFLLVRAIFPDEF
jgi:hypothetical protein